MREVIPLGRRPLDAALVLFFVVNLTFTTYVVSLEQVAIADPAHFAPLAWPPQRLLALVHWWERGFDPLLWARPAWYRATVWLDVLVFGPFYAVAIFAYARGREWIRVPSIIWATMLFTNVVIILSDEIWGIHASPHPAVVVLANAPWAIVPVIVVARMWGAEHPFTEPAEARPG
ncbi:MAG TPA: emopamil-binding family protein [Anaeromyxobacteraceae bacterium]|nr:emopamil-binding family protein [Anaeromyxobacteraceae bacterium]